MTKKKAGGNPARHRPPRAWRRRRDAAVHKGPAPVHLWDPPFCGDLDIRIARDGTWFYLGTPIGRLELVKLFGSILQARGRRVFPRHPGRKGRHHGRRRALRGGGFHRRGRRARPADHLRDQCRRQGHRRPRPPDPRRARPRNRRARALCRDPRRPRGADRPQELLTGWSISGRTRTTTAQRWFGLWSGGRFFPLIPSADLPA